MGPPLLTYFLLLIFQCLQVAPQHPLDSLTTAEYTRVANAVRTFRPGDWTFSWILPKEPPKADLLPYFLSNVDPPVGTIPRKAFFTAYDNNVHRSFEGVFNLDSNVIESFLELNADTEPLFTSEELSTAKVIAYTNPAVQARCAQLGFTNMANVHSDAWYSGYVGDKPEYAGKRVVVLFMYGSMFVGDNFYAHPFDFNVPVDLTNRQVLAIENLPTHDNFDANNTVGNVVPTVSHNYDPVLFDDDFFRKDIKPVQVSQPDGVSFKMEGGVLNWQKFQMRLSFNAREGLVIHHVSYNDSGRIRPLFYRMSMAEMFVPYGDPRPPHHRKHAFDVGEYGLGFCLVELEDGIDCVGETLMVNAEMHDHNGAPYTVHNAACIREEDAGILWKHYDAKTDHMSTTRAQKLALTMIVNVDNYDYIVTWKFAQDASIELEAKLTGILNSNLLAVNAGTAGHGTQVAPQINAQYHQHLFSLRLDVEIDGNDNSVVMQDVVPIADEPGSEGNPYGQGVTTKVTSFKTAGQSRSNVAPEHSRTWIIRNGNAINPNTKQPVGWKLMPWPSQTLLVDEKSPIFPQAAWANYSTWVVPYKEDQLFPGGFYLNGTGLHDWVGENENANIANTDIVLWHNFGITHVPRVEDFPVMPVETIGLFLKPVNFFNGNPAVDVPPPAKKNQRKPMLNRKRM